MDLKLNVSKNGLNLSAEGVNNSADAILHFGQVFRGADGKSAYQQAVEAGYKGSEEDFKELLLSYPNKADKEGYYPAMSVGMADNLVGRGDVQDAHINFRQSAGADNITDGAARIERIKGNSVVWNQWVKNAKFRNGTTDWGKNNTQLSIVGAKLRIENLTGNSQGVTQSISIPAKHKIVLHCHCTRSSSKASPCALYLQRKNTSGYDIVRSDNISSTNAQNLFLTIDTTDEIKTILFYPFLNGEIGSYVDVDFINLHDLTQMFGASNEPTTVEEYLQRKPMNIENEYAYNEGELIDMKVDSLVSVGDNAYKGGEARVMGNVRYDISDSENSSDLQVFFHTDREAGIYDEVEVLTDDKGQQYCTFMSDGYCYVQNGSGEYAVCLNHSYHKGIKPYQQDVKDLSWIWEIRDNDGNQLFSNGMRSAGSVFDEIRFNPTKKVWEAVKRIGVVDLGSLSWYLDSGLGGFYAPYIEPEPKIGFSALCAKYPFKGVYSNAKDGESGWVYNNNLFVKDSNFTDAASLKYSLDGVMLYYELAEPIVVELDYPTAETNMDYLVWDFGTEEAIAVDEDNQPIVSAPFRADIKYADNFVDDIRKNKEDIATNKTAIAKNTAAINVLKAKATPSGDAMHYAYEAIGAKWNANTGYWEFYDMKDITNIEMSRALARGSWYIGATAIGVMSAFNEQSSSAIRFNIARTGPYNANCDFDYFAQENKWIEFINLTFDNNMVSKPFSYALYLAGSFNGCSNLRRIYGEINVVNAKNEYTNTFTGCVKLEDVEIYGLNKAISFADSPLSVESATYMIANADSSATFTITFRADRQALFEANSDFIAAKSAKPNITIMYQ